jgi:hypothetical protein
MPFFPVKSYEIKSSAKPSDIVATLSAHVQPLPIVTRLGGHKTFAGSVSETGFRFVRVGENRNSFRPTVLGKFLSSNQLTIVQITIKHDAFYFIPLAIMFFSFVAFSLNSLLPFLTAVSSNNAQEIQKYLSPPHLLFLLSPIAMLFIGYISPVVLFETEANAAKRELAEILAPFILKPEYSSQ